MKNENFGPRFRYFSFCERTEENESVTTGKPTKSKYATNAFGGERSNKQKKMCWYE